MIKNKILYVVLALAIPVGTVSAQSYVGGSFGLNGGVNQNTGTGSLLNSFTLTAAPDIGWIPGERWAVGIRPTVGLGLSSGNSRKQRALTLGVNPYTRYKMLTFNNFGLWTELSPELGLYNIWHQDEGVERPSGVWSSDTRSLNYSLRLLPVLTYQLNRHILLETRLNLFSVALVGRHTITSATEDTFDTFSYGVNASMDDLVDTWENLSIGFLYIF